MNRRSLFGVLGSCAVLSYWFSCGMREDASQPSAENGYPTTPPLWIVEDDPNELIFDRKDLERDRKVGEMLVIPLYMNYQHQQGDDFLAIAHPFVYRQGEEIEPQLTAIGQRERLRRLILWVPGYFPDGLGRTFNWMPTINGKRLVVVELHRCLGQEEEEQLDAAMKTLLEGDIVVGKGIPSTPPSNSDKPQMTRVPYNFSELVRSEYSGRFYKWGAPIHNHALWAFPPGTRIVNRLSREEKATVIAFAAKALRRRHKNITEGHTPEATRRP